MNTTLRIIYGFQAVVLLAGLIQTLHGYMRSGYFHTPTVDGFYLVSRCIILMLAFGALSRPSPNVSLGLILVDCVVAVFIHAYFIYSMAFDAIFAVKPLLESIEEVGLYLAWVALLSAISMTIAGYILKSWNELTEYKSKNKKEPNNALEPSRLPVTFRAFSVLRTGTNRARQPAGSA